MKQSLFAFKAGLGAGLLSVLCCAGPVVAILLGFGGASMVYGLDKYRAVFIITGILILSGASFYAVRKNRKCCSSRSLKREIQIVALIFGSGISCFGLFQYGLIPIATNLAEKRIETPLPPNSETSELKIFNLQVAGMTCASCSLGVKKAFDDVSGVHRAEVDWASGAVTVIYDPRQTGPETILKAEIPPNYKLSAEKPLNDKKDQ